MPSRATSSMSRSPASRRGSRSRPDQFPVRSTQGPMRSTTRTRFTGYRSLPLHRHVALSSSFLLLVGGLAVWPACSTADSRAADRPAAPPAPIAVEAVQAVEQPLARYLRATGTLLAEDQASVSAEIAGRVVAT